MAHYLSAARRRSAGFSLIEMLVVVGIILVMSAVSLPAIGSYYRNYRIRGAAQQVASELQAARSKAIGTNTNAGVSFLVVDSDSYRWVQEDLTGNESYSPLRDLPSGVTFVVSGTASSGTSLRFNRLGSFCNPAAGAPCAAPFGPACIGSESSLRCTTGAGFSYVGPQAAGSATLQITLLENSTNLKQGVRILPGGRILAQPVP